MKTMEEGAKEFVDAPCDWLCANCATDKMSCRFYNDKESFKAGEEWMREKLTRWHDPKEPPQDQKHKLIKLDDCGYTLFATGQWCPDSKRWWGAGIDENSKVIGWREIHG